MIERDSKTEIKRLDLVFLNFIIIPPFLRIIYFDIMISDESYFFNSIIIKCHNFA